MNITEMIFSGRNDSSIALVLGEAQITYAELRRAVSQRTSELVTSGAKPGNRIGLVSENSFFWVSSYLAIIRAGMVAVPLACEGGARMFEEVAAEAGFKRVFASSGQAKKVRAWCEGRGIEVLTPPEGDASGAPAREFASEPRSGADLAAIVFTSGSTGRPKGVMITHRNIECNARDIIQYMGLTAADRVMVVLPFHYCFGASLLHSVLMAGGCLVLNNKFKLFPEAVLQDMQKTECTGFAGVPSTYQILLRRSRFKSMKFPSLRWLQQAGGKLPNACIQEVRESFPNVRFYTMYGQTEATARLSYLPPERLSDKLGSIGKGLPSTELRVVRADGQPVRPGSEETGELIAQGNNISPGYWNDPEETAKYFRDGWLHTGDVARVDAEGFIYIVDRQRDFIKAGGNRVSAKEVEEVICELPDVVEVAVVGAEHEILGEAIHAFIVPVPGSAISPRTVQAHCAQRLAAFKVPEAVHFVRAVPHNGSGKVMKQELRKFLAEFADPSGGAQVSAESPDSVNEHSLFSLSLPSNGGKGIPELPE